MGEYLNLLQGCGLRSIQKSIVDRELDKDSKLRKRTNGRHQTSLLHDAIFLCQNVNQTARRRPVKAEQRGPRQEQLTWTV
jgi:hypothetical protein